MASGSMRPFAVTVTSIRSRKSLRFTVSFSILRKKRVPTVSYSISESLLELKTSLLSLENIIMISGLICEIISESSSVVHHSLNRDVQRSLEFTTTGSSVFASGLRLALVFSSMDEAMAASVFLVFTAKEHAPRRHRLRV